MKTENNLNVDEPPSGYSPLEKIISEIYVEYAEIITTVRKHYFETTLYPVLKKVNDYINSGNYESIPYIAGILLTTINDKLTEVSGRDKEILEELTSQLFKSQLAILNSTTEGQLCWKKCIPIIKETCEFKGYDYTSLSQLMGFTYVTKISHSKKKSEKAELPYYEWIGKKDGQCLELIRDLKDKQWIRSVNEFKKMFKPISDPKYTFCAPTDNIEKLLLLFSELKKEKLIQPKRNRGHLHPLYLYGVDLDKKLFKKEPKRYLENLARKKESYDAILAEVQKLIRMNT